MVLTEDNNNNENLKKIKIYYKIKWKGHPMSACTWEERKNLGNLYKGYFKKADRDF